MISIQRNAFHRNTFNRLTIHRIIHKYEITLEGIVNYSTFTHLYSIHISILHKFYIMVSSNKQRIQI